MISNEKMRFRWEFWLINLALLSGFLLSILSWLELCVEHCSANQDYRIFSLPFAIFGMSFFVIVLVLHNFFQRNSFLSDTLVGWLIASALGAELMFILVQKNQIGHWCPVCLSIATSIAFAALVRFTSFIKDKSIWPLLRSLTPWSFHEVQNPLLNHEGYISQNFQHYNQGEIMQKVKQGLSNTSFVVLGFLMAFIGISNPDPAEAAISDIKEKIAFGTKNSPVEVYFVSDWFCPSCKKVEPLIEKIYPKIKSKVTFYFIDYSIHKKSLNFTPYNLSFLMNDKSQYFKARQMLLDLADKTESPTDEQVEKVSKKGGIPFKELTFLDVKTGIEFFDKVVDKFDLKSTPTVIITNPKRNQTVILEGRDEISEEKILNAIDKLTPGK